MSGLLQRIRLKILYTDSWQMGAVFVSFALVCLLIVLLLIDVFSLKPAIVKNKKEVVGQVIEAISLPCKAKLSCSNGYKQDIKIKLTDGRTINIISFNPLISKGNQIVLIERTLTNDKVNYSIDRVEDSKP